MAAATEELPDFRDLTEAQLRQWVEANPGRVNDRDRYYSTPLFTAAVHTQSLSLTVWLLDEKGADVNGTNSAELAPLCFVASLEILTTLLDRGADPTLLTNMGWTPLMRQAFWGRLSVVARLLQDSRVRATVDVQNYDGGDTALHLVCRHGDKTSATSIVHLLLQNGADPALRKNDCLTPLGEGRHRFPARHAVIVLLEQAPDAEKASLLVKARRLAVAAAAGNAVAPAYLQGRVARGEPLPHMVLLPVVADLNEDEEQKARKLRTLMAFVLGMEGGWENAGMPRDVFRVVLDLLMPTWDPLRRKDAGAGLVVQG